jgi:hypothetical protein
MARSKRENLSGPDGLDSFRRPFYTIAILDRRGTNFIPGQRNIVRPGIF